eukprot:GHVR01011577.1.p1 GENE.GHVR01011577.1~~GHVR01011577.1.p1  ORF type:complete len:497 (+),score=60.24 GHVR01011577.1:365-1855(+)
MILIEDLLTIRADRTGYYYGRPSLFKYHPDLIKVLKNESPELLKVVFDGCVWESTTVQNGKRRTNYYIAELWGDPSSRMGAFVWQSPLAELVKFGDPDIMSHPTIEFLINLKWKHYGRTTFMIEQTVNMLVLLFFTLGFAAFGEPEKGSDIISSIITFRIIACALTALQFCYILFGAMFILLFREPTQVTKNIVLPYQLLNKWKIMRVIYAVCTLVAYAGDPTFAYEWLPHAVSFLAIASVLVWLLLLEVVVALPALAAFFHAVMRMLGDVLKFFAILLLVLCAFGSALTIVAHKSEDFISFGRSVYVLLCFVLQIREPNVIDDQTFPVTGIIAFILFTACAIILLLNLLIAQITTAYEYVHLKVKGYALIDKAKFCLEGEAGTSIKKRIDIFKQLGLDYPLDFDVNEVGPSGGVQVLEPSYKRMLEGTIYGRNERPLRFSGPIGDKLPWPKSERVKMPSEEKLMALLQDLNKDDEKKSGRSYITKRLSNTSKSRY